MEIERLQNDKQLYLPPILLDRFMSCPQIIAWYSRRDMMGDVDIDVVAENLDPVKCKIRNCNHLHWL